MAPKELVERIEAEFEDYDRIESEKLDEIVRKKEHLKSVDKKGHSHSFKDIRKRFNHLPLLMNTQHIDLEGEIKEENYEVIREISKKIYIEAINELHRIRYDDMSNEDIKKQMLRGKRYEDIAPPKSLHKKLKLHLMVGELYCLLGVRTDPDIKDKGAVAEFKKVTNEGAQLFEHYLDNLFSREPTSEQFLETVKLTRDIATAYTRLGALYEKAGNKEESEDTYCHAHGKFFEMFDLNNGHHTPWNIDAVFPSKEAFKRYLLDIQKTSSPCTFQYLENDEMSCIKTTKETNLCDCRQGDSCSYMTDSLEELKSRALSARDEYKKTNEQIKKASANLV